MPVQQQRRRPRFRIVTRASLKRLAVLFTLIGGAITWMYFAMIRMPGKSYSGELPPASEREVSLADALRADVTMLARDIGVRNTMHPQKLDAAAAFIEQTLTDLGYTPARQEYEVDGVLCANIEAELTGATKPDEIIVLGAHYDSPPGSPGANDNGTGVAAVLAMARAYADQSPARTMRFVLFVNEEPPYFQTAEMGSRVYARRCRAQNDNIVAMICYETIGYYSDEDGSQRYPPLVGLAYPSQGNFIAIVGNYGSRKLVRDTVSRFRRLADFPSQGAALPGFVPGVGWSDHWAFWKEGYEALMLTDTAPFRYEHYHQPTDTPDKIDYDRMARVVEGMHRVIDEIANE